MPVTRWQSVGGGAQPRAQLAGAGVPLARSNSRIRKHRASLPVSFIDFFHHARHRVKQIFIHA
jgi:hypothetical protein